MDNKRFDSLTRAFASGASRRSVIKGLLGLGGAAVTGTVVDDAAEARRTRSSRNSPPPCQGEVCGTFCCEDPPGCNAFGNGCCREGTLPCTTNSTGCCADCTGNPNGSVQCGYDCCEVPDQCCDEECCRPGDLCVARVFNCSDYFCEERCCPEEQLCDGQCCDGTCFFPSGYGDDDDDDDLDRTCCPASGEICSGFNGTLCCEGDTPDCCVRQGQAICINRETQCCDNTDCDAFDDPANCRNGVCRQGTQICATATQTNCAAGESCCIGGDNECCPTDVGEVSQVCCGPNCCAQGMECCERTVRGVLTQTCIDPETQCCTRSDCVSDFGFDPDCVNCRASDHTCRPRNEGEVCDDTPCGLCNDRNCVDQCPDLGLTCNENGNCVCNGPEDCNDDLCQECTDGECLDRCPDLGLVCDGDGNCICNDNSDCDDNDACTNNVCDPDNANADSKGCVFPPIDCGDCGECSGGSCVSLDNCTGACDICVGDASGWDCEPDPSCCEPACSGCQICQQGAPGSTGTCVDDDTQCGDCGECSGGSCVSLDNCTGACDICVGDASGWDCEPDPSCCEPACSGCQICEVGEPGSTGTCVDDDTKCGDCGECDGGSCTSLDNCGLCKTCAGDSANGFNCFNVAADTECGDCMTCDGQGTCGSICQNPDTDVCCPVTEGPDYCLDSGSTCCTTNANCGTCESCVDGACVSNGGIVCGSACCNVATEVCCNDTCVTGNCCDATDCDDNDPCTQNICSNNVCSNPPVDCSGSSDQCNVGTCNPADGTCVPVPVGDGTACLSGDPCTVGDTCQAGVCQSGGFDCNADPTACCPGESCVGDPGTCQPSCANNTEACTGAPGTQGSCCDGLICNGSSCEIPCGQPGAPDTCLCNMSFGGTGTQTCPAAAPCCRAPGSSLARCSASSKGNCTCETQNDNGICTPFSPQDTCCPDGNTPTGLACQNATCP